MTTTLHMMDADNRDDHGASFQITGTPEQVIAYLNGPLRNDLLPEAQPKADTAAALLKAKLYSEARAFTRHLGIYIDVLSLQGENITVQELGEEGDAFLVTGTTDAHSADEAVRTHFEHVTGTTLEDAFHGEDLHELSIQHRTDWRWANGGTHPADEEDYLITGGTEGPRFAGFMLQA